MRCGRGAGGGGAAAARSSAGLRDCAGAGGSPLAGRVTRGGAEARQEASSETSYSLVSNAADWEGGRDRSRNAGFP